MIRKNTSFLLLLFASFGLSSFAYAQCGAGFEVGTVVLDVIGTSGGAAGDADNTTGMVCGFEPGVNIDGVEWDITINPAGTSWCSEPVIDLNGEIALTPGAADENAGPCNNPYTGGSTTIVPDNGLTLTPDASGCITFEWTESYDDGPGVDASLAGMITFTGCVAIVPVEMLYFEATAMEEGVLLDWATASELNNAGFEVERSKDGATWEMLNFVKGNGTTVEQQQYKWLDGNPLQRVNYYRLKQVDTNGKYDYSDILVINSTGKDGDVTLVTFPNPVQDVLNYQFEAVEHTVDIYDQTGRLLISFQQGAETTHALSVSDLPSGLYNLILRTADGMKYHQKFIK